MKPLCLAAALILLAAPAMADPLTGAYRLLADTNRDGKVSPEEYQSSRRAFLMRADRNHDGRISRAEWDRAASDLREEVRYDGVEGAEKIGHGGWFAMLDANKDGFVTPAEIDAATRLRFQRLDLNHDGFIDRNEGRRLERAAGGNPN